MYGALPSLAQSSEWCREPCLTSEYTHVSFLSSLKVATHVPWTIRSVSRSDRRRFLPRVGEGRTGRMSFREILPVQWVTLPRNESP